MGKKIKVKKLLVFSVLFLLGSLGTVDTSSIFKVDRSPVQQALKNIDLVSHTEPMFGAVENANACTGNICYQVCCYQSKCLEIRTHYPGCPNTQ